MLDYYWLFVVKKDVRINQVTYNKLKALINPIKARAGKNRKASEVTDEEVFLLDNNFFVEKYK